ncbi:MAG: hypothetical protein NVS2B12_41510 [Ktedonobacteraceae bacterium]
MSQPAQLKTEVLKQRLKLRQHESEAKLIPYISFILTHVALVLFLIVAFFLDRFVPNPGMNLIVKIVLAVIAVLFLASEWFYAIRTSLRWKKMITTVAMLEEEQRMVEEQERQRQHENALALEQLRNRALQLDIQRRRDSREQAQQVQQVQSVRPASSLHPYRLRPELPYEQSQQNSRRWNA